MQDERLREDAKQLLRVAYERQVASGDVGLGVDFRRPRSVAWAKTVPTWQH